MMGRLALEDTDTCTLPNNDEVNLILILKSSAGNCLLFLGVSCRFRQILDFQTSKRDPWNGEDHRDVKSV